MTEHAPRPDHERPRFSLGQIYATPGALAACEEAGTTLLPYFARHATGDWGDIHPDDRGLNEQALIEGSRIFSVYALPTAKTLWVITEADRSATTALLPSEY
jgi:hypothetical protein